MTKCVFINASKLSYSFRVYYGRYEYSSSSDIYFSNTIHYNRVRMVLKIKERH